MVFLRVVCVRVCVMVYQCVTIRVADSPMLAKIGVYTHLIGTANADARVPSAYASACSRPPLCVCVCVALCALYMCIAQSVGRSAPGSRSVHVHCAQCVRMHARVCMSVCAVQCRAVQCAHSAVQCSARTVPGSAVRIMTCSAVRIAPCSAIGLQYC